MLGSKEGFPADGEIILCTVTKIYHHSVFVSLDEYKGRSGMLHISEVSPGRIRNLRDYVSEGKKIVCKVLSINRDRGHIDVSLRRVTESQKKQKASDLKQEQICTRIIEAVAKTLKQKQDELHKTIEAAVKKEEYELVAHAFDDVANDELDLENILEKKLAKELTAVIKTRIKPPEVEIIGFLSLSTYHEDGVEIIKKVLEPLEKANMNPVYVGSGKYKINTKAPDYKTAEKQIKEQVDYVLEAIKEYNGEGTFERAE